MEPTRHPDGAPAVTRLAAGQIRRHVTNPAYAAAAGFAPGRGRRTGRAGRPYWTRDVDALARSSKEPSRSTTRAPECYGCWSGRVARCGVCGAAMSTRKQGGNGRTVRFQLRVYAFGHCTARECLMPDAYVAGIVVERTEPTTDARARWPARRRRSRAARRGAVKRAERSDLTTRSNQVHERWTERRVARTHRETLLPANRGAEPGAGRGIPYRCSRGGRRHDPAARWESLEQDQGARS